MPSTWGQSSESIEKEITALDNSLKQHGRNPDSLKYYATKLLALAKSNNHETGLFKAYLALGQAETRTGNPKNSNEYLHKALKLADIVGNNDAQIGIRNNIGINHRRLRRNDSALFYFKEIDKKYSELGLEEPSNMAKMKCQYSF